MPETMKWKKENRLNCFISGKCYNLRTPSILNDQVPCVNGYANASNPPYPCQNVDLLSFIDFDGLGCPGAQGNDIWGWNHAPTNRDFAIFGCTTGVSFIDITNPLMPQVIGMLPTQSGASTWRDMKVYQGFAFIVSEAINHGLQVFNLTRLVEEKSPGPGRKYTADVVYTDQMGTQNQRSTHNVAINEDTGFLYLVGCRTCSGGLLIVDIRNPMNPAAAGCFAGDGYTHDTQCVVYHGPDHRFQGNEICLAFNEDSLTIVDVTDKSNMVMLSRVPYYGVRYTHQGWITEDHSLLLMDDELDEMYKTYDTTQKTVTYVWDISNLGEPINTGAFQSPVVSIDHNQYIEGDFVYQANYASGLLIWNGLQSHNDPEWKPKLVGYFDVHPTEDVADFYGSWSVYPYYTSDANKNTIVLTSIEIGLFVLRFDKSAIY